MLNTIAKYKFRITAVAAMVLLLALVRAYEDTLFFDPLLMYFKADFSNAPLPELQNPALYWNLFLRYSINSILSIVIIHAVFNDRELTNFTSLLYCIFFVVLIIAFFLVVEFIGSDNKMMLFYVRRFLIQPILLLLFIPAFYFQKRGAEKNNIS